MRGGSASAGRHGLRIIGLGLLLATATAGAFDTGIDGLRVDGFFTQNYLRSTHNNLFGESTRGTFDYTEAGLALSWAPAPSFLLAGQALYRHAGTTEEGARLDYLMAVWTPLATEDASLSLRVGRIKNPIGLFNETRDVAFTRPSLLLPQSIYLDGIGVRDALLSSDGFGLHGELRGDWGAVDTDFVVALPYDLSDEVRDAFFWRLGAQGTLHAKRTAYARLGWLDPEGRLRLALSGLTNRSEYQPRTGEPIPEFDVSLDQLILSGQYVQGDWTLTSEIVRRRILIDPFGQQSNRPHLGYYVQAGRRFGGTFETYLRHDALYADLTDKSGRRQSSGLGPEPAWHQFARDWTAGIGWQPQRQVLLRAEFHHIDGSGWIAFQDNEPDVRLGTDERKWNLLMFQLSLRF